MYPTYDSGSYSQYNDVLSSGTGFEGIFAAILGGLALFLVLIIVLAVFQFIGTWKILSKMDKKGWIALIPGASNFVLNECIGVNNLWLVIVCYGTILNIIPIIGGLAFFAVVVYFWILTNVSLAKSFGKSTGFAVGLCLLPPVFYFILGIGKDKYLGAKPMNDIIFKNKDLNQNTNSNHNVNIASNNSVNNGFNTNDVNVNPNNTFDSNNVNNSAVGNTSVTTKFCPSCGTELSQEARFCPKCGQNM